MRRRHRLFNGGHDIRLSVQLALDFLRLVAARYLVFLSAFEGQNRTYLSALLRENGRKRPVLLRLEILYLALALNDESERYALHSACGQLALYLTAKHGREFITHESVQNAARLLRVHKVLVYLARVFNRLCYSLFGYFVKRYTRFVVFGQSEYGRNMPRNGLALAVGVRCEIYAFRASRFLFKLCHDLFLVGHHFVSGREIVFHVHGKRLCGQIADVPHRCEYLITVTEIFLYCGPLAHAFYDYEFQHLPHKQ